MLEKAEWYVIVLVSVGLVAALAAATVAVVVAAATEAVVVAAAVAVLPLLLLLLTPFFFLELLYLIFLCKAGAYPGGGLVGLKSSPKFPKYKYQIFQKVTFCPLQISKIEHFVVPGPPQI